MTVPILQFCFIFIHLLSTVNADDINFNSTRLVFVIAVGRSGSTLLMRLLNAAPGMCMRGENNALLESVYEAYESAALTRRYSMADTSWRESWAGYERSDPTAFLGAMLSAFASTVLRCPANATALGFKEIHTGARTRRFIDFALRNDGLPNAFFVFNRRNVTAVARSRTRINWSDSDSSTVIAQAYTYFTQTAARYPSRAIVVDYDQYAREPASLRRLFAFLGLDFNLAGIMAQMNRQVN
jgi:hypothetical protein